MALSLPTPDDGLPGLPGRAEPAGDAYRAARSTRRARPDSFTLAHRALLELLANLSRANGVAWPSERWLAGQLCLSDRHVRRLLNQLHEMGCLAIRTQRGKTNRYTVLRDQPQPPPSLLQIAPASRPNAGAASLNRKSPGVRGRKGRARPAPVAGGGKPVDNPAQTPDMTSGGGGHDVRTRPRTSCPPTKDQNTFTGPPADPSLFDPRAGWFSVWDLPHDGKSPQAALLDLFRQGACRSCCYGGKDPRYASCQRRVRTVLSLVPGRSVVFLKLAVDGQPGRREEVTVHVKTLAAWRFK